MPSPIDSSCSKPTLIALAADDLVLRLHFRALPVPPGALSRDMAFERPVRTVDEHHFGSLHGEGVHDDAAEPHELGSPRGAAAPPGRVHSLRSLREPVGAEPTCARAS